MSEIFIGYRRDDGGQSFHTNRELPSPPLRRPELRRRVLWEAHPDTSISAFSLLPTMAAQGELGRAEKLFRDELAWLLERNPADLGADQRYIREQLLQRPNKYPPADGDPSKEDKP